MPVSLMDKGLDAADTMFSMGDSGTGPVDLANDALEDDEATLTTPSETSHSIASSYKRRDLVSHCSHLTRYCLQLTVGSAIIFSTFQ